MTLPISIFLYGVQGLLAGIISLTTYITSKNTGSVAFKNFSTFFFFVFLFLIGTALLAYLLLFLDVALITSGFIGLRILVFIAIMYLIQIPVFKFLSFIEKYLEYIIASLIIIAFIATVLQIINFEEVKITDNGIIILNMDRTAAWLIGLTSLSISLVWAWSQILFLLSEMDDEDFLLKIKVIMLCIGGLALGVGDILYVLAKSSEQSLAGSLFATFGYSLVVLVLIVFHIQRLVSGRKFNSA